MYCIVATKVLKELSCLLLFLYIFVFFFRLNNNTYSTWEIQLLIKILHIFTLIQRHKRKEGIQQNAYNFKMYIHLYEWFATAVAAGTEGRQWWLCSLLHLFVVANVGFNSSVFLFILRFFIRAYVHSLFFFAPSSLTQINIEC